MASKPVGHGANISIHALREEGDFNTPSIGQDNNTISIHALREEGDIVCARSRPDSKNFYPRPPRGGRPKPVQCQ